jgi:hypothetical protein
MARHPASGALVYPESKNRNLHRQLLFGEEQVLFVALLSGAE